MYKAYRYSALIATTLSTVLSAWGQKSPFDQAPEPVDIHFPLNPNQAWAAEESLLIWKTYEDDTDYAVRRLVTSDTVQNTKQSIKHPDFEWSTGIRLKLTRYLPSNDPWDINLITTYYYDQAEDETSVNFSLLNSSSQRILLPTWDTAASGSVSKARASTHMNFFTFDLTAGRYYSLTKKINIHPFIGVRTVLNYQKTQALLVKSQFKGEFDFWGIGPRVGTDLSLRLGRHWALVGTFGASLFGGRYDVDENFNGQVEVVSTFTPYHVKLTDNDTVLRSNIDASLGLGWEKWVRGKTVRIAPSFVFEVSEWFSLKRWVDSHLYGNSLSSGSHPVVYPHRRYSDLGLMGFNVNLQVDF